MSKKIKNYNPLTLMLFAIAGSLIMFGCTKEEKQPAKSMEQIRIDEGVPIEVQIVKSQPFEKYLSFFSKLSGIKESTKNSMVTDNISKINVKVGDNVKEGQIVMEFPSNNPALQISQAKAGYDNAEKLYNRMKELLKTGETSQQNFDGAETQYLVAKRNWESLRQMIYVESPIAGIIVEIFVKEGDDVERDRPLFTVAQLNRMKAKIWCSESEVALLRNGDKAILTVAGKQYTGRISEISLSMDDVTRAFGVEVQVDNPRRELLSGVTVDVKIKVYSNPSAISLPRSLIKKEGNQQFVYIENGEKAEKRAIRTGQESSLDVEVTDGLKPGDRLIVKGASLLVDGTKVKVLNQQ